METGTEGDPKMTQYVLKMLLLLEISNICFVPWNMLRNIENQQISSD